MHDQAVAAREFFELDVSTHVEDESDESARQQAGLGRDAASEVTVGDEATEETPRPLAVEEQGETKLFYVLPATSQDEEEPLRNLADRGKAPEDGATLYAARQAGGVGKLIDAEDEHLAEDSRRKADA